jgi:Mg-chelatase subunit ChlD
MTRKSGMLIVFLILATAAPYHMLAAPRDRTAPDAAPIAVLVDTSQAMTPYTADLRSALQGFFREMQDTRKMALFEFGERPSLIANYTTDVARLQAGVARLFPRPGSGAYTLDAIVEAAHGLRGDESARPVIVVITTEGPEFSERYHQTVIDELKKTNASLHAFVLDKRHPSFLDSSGREREFALSRGASETGGRREDLLTSMALAGRLHNLAAELRAGS